MSPVEERRHIPHPWQPSTPVPAKLVDMSWELTQIRRKGQGLDKRMRDEWRRHDCLWDVACTDESPYEGQ